MHVLYILPVGSPSAGNMSPPHIPQAATAVTIPANPVACQYTHRNLLSVIKSCTKQEILEIC